MWLGAFQVAWKCFNVAPPYFEEILLDLKEEKTNKQTNNNSSDVLVECVQLAALLESVNVCEAAEVPEEQAGK